QLQRFGQGVGDDEKNDPDEDLHRAAPVEHEKHPIDDEAGDRDLEPVAPRGMQHLNLIEAAHAPCPATVAGSAAITAQATSSAWRFGFTSCTRNRRAPRSSAATFAAIVPMTRAAGSNSPVNSPTKRLRDAPINT